MSPRGAEQAAVPEPGRPAPASLPPPSWPRRRRCPAGFGLPHVFPIMWNGLKTAVAGPYLGVPTAVRGMSLPSPPPSRGPALCGTCPVLLTSVPLPSSSLGASGHVTRGPGPGRVASPPGGGQPGLGRSPLPPRPVQRGLHTGAGGVGLVVDGAARRTSAGTFHRCWRGQGTKRRRGRGRGRNRGVRCRV